MNVHEVQCPYCWEFQTIEIEEDVSGSFVQDCYVCCRPWMVRVYRGEDGEAQVSLERAD